MPYLLMDTMYCVFCKSEEFVPATNKNPRKVNVCCEKCQPTLFPKEVGHVPSSAKPR